VWLTKSELTDSQKKAVNEAEKKIKDGKITVPNHPKGSDFNQKF
ncbi:MAG: BMP family lipoprotein, partial [Leuconostoc fallax]